MSSYLFEESHTAKNETILDFDDEYHKHLRRLSFNLIKVRSIENSIINICLSNKLLMIRLSSRMIFLNTNMKKIHQYLHLHVSQQFSLK